MWQEEDLSRQNVSSHDWPPAGDQGSPAGGRDVAAEEDDWVANLKHRRAHYRCFDMATPEGNFVVEYYGRGMGDELEQQVTSWFATA